MKVSRYDVGAGGGIGIVCLGLWMVWAPLGVLALGGFVLAVVGFLYDESKKSKESDA